MPVEFSLPSACSLYLAPSTLPNAGLGVFTGRPLKRGEKLPSLDSAIPILDLEWHNAAADDYAGFGHRNPFNDYVWAGRPMGMAREATSLEYLTIFWPGVDAVVNSYPPLINLERALPIYQGDSGGSSGCHRSQYAAAGSFSPYQGNWSFVKEYVPAGGELFKDYGDEWFRQRGMDSTTPVLSNVLQAEGFLERFYWRILQQGSSNNHNKKENAALFPENASRLYELAISVRDIWNRSSTMFMAIPPTWEEARSIFEHYRQHRSMKQALRAWYQPKTTRSLEWLQTNGICWDDLEVAPSTLPGVGQGAFATRSFAPGDVITRSPVISIRDNELLEMYEIAKHPDDSRKYIRQEKIGVQLMKNYCFSHGKIIDGIAFCPYGKGVTAINHALERQAVNVRMEWPSDIGWNHNASLLQIPPDQWNFPGKPALSFQYVATRPIQPGDELFIDYGPEWEKAWHSHVKKWQQESPWTQPGPMGLDYISATTWNQRYDHADVLHTREELLNNASLPANTVIPPPSLELRCHSGLLGEPHAKHYRLRWDGDWTNPGPNYEYGLPCHVLSRRQSQHNNDDNQESWLYHVQIAKGHETLKELHDIPRRLLRWFDEVYTTELHSPSAFRHFLELPEVMIPKAWRIVEMSVHERTSTNEKTTSSEIIQDNEAVSPLDENIKSTAKLEEKINSTAQGESEVSCGAANSFSQSDELSSSSYSSLQCEIGAANDEASTVSDGVLRTNSDVQCGLYIAPSSIEGAGLGVFAGRDYEVGDLVGYGDILIPLAYMEHDLDFRALMMYENVFEDYVWDASFLGLGPEMNESVGVFWPGTNAATNCNPALINLDLSFPEEDVAQVHRWFHPGAGAFTPFHKGISKTARFVPQGGEFFKDYGPDYFLYRESLQGVPVVADFDQATALLQSMFQDITNLDHRMRPLVYDLMLNIRKLWPSRVLTAIPNSFPQAKQVVESYDGDFGLLHQPDHTRDLSWLETNGRCIDRIIPKKSTIDGAGRGAFADQFLAKGTILTGTPLLHIRNHLLSRSSSNHSSDRFSDMLLTNYCFSSPLTSLLLCPYSSGVNYINHNQTQANVRVHWASHGFMGHDNGRFLIPPWHFDHMKMTALALDYVVIRDIQPGEEFFLDYGDDYEMSWQKYVKEWEPKSEWQHYTSAKDMNEVPLLKTLAEQKEEPYPDNLLLHCHSTLKRYAIKDLMKYGVNLTDPEHLKMLFAWHAEQAEAVDYGLPCEIRGRQQDASSEHFFYDVTITVTNGDDSGDTTLTKLQRSGVPRCAIQFFDASGTKDYQLPTAFRHVIGLRDEMIPAAWRDMM